MAIVRVPLQIEENLRDSLKAYGKVMRRTTNALVIELIEEALEARLNELKGDYEAYSKYVDFAHTVWRKASDMHPENLTPNHLPEGSEIKAWFEEELEGYISASIEGLEEGEKMWGEDNAQFIEEFKSRDFIELKFLEDIYTDLVDHFKLIRGRFTALNGVLNKQDAKPLVDDNMMITHEGLNRILAACELEGTLVEFIGEKFLYKYSEAWLDRAYGREPLSKRALNKLRAWLEEVESKH